MSFYVCWAPFSYQNIKTVRATAIGEHSKCTTSRGSDIEIDNYMYSIINVSKSVLTSVLVERTEVARHV